jgi:hypothetical protein
MKLRPALLFSRDCTYRFRVKLRHGTLTWQQGKKQLIGTDAQMPVVGHDDKDGDM